MGASLLGANPLRPRKLGLLPRTLRLSGENHPEALTPICQRACCYCRGRSRTVATDRQSLKPGVRSRSELAAQFGHDFFAGSADWVAAGISVGDPLLAAKCNGGNAFNIGTKDVRFSYVMRHAIVAAFVGLSGVRR